MSETGAEGRRAAVSPSVVRGLVGYVESALGPGGLDDLVARLPGEVTVRDLISARRWWELADFGELLSAATALTGDSDLGRRAGEQTFRDVLGGNLADAILVAGTTEAACAALAEYAARFDSTRTLRVIESTPNHVLLEGVPGPGVTPSTFTCGFTSGYFASLPTLFGQLGTAAEIACQSHGAPACLYRVAWRPDPSRPNDASASAEDRRMRGFTALDQLELQHQMAARLVESHEIDDVLERIVTSVSVAVGAPRYVLAVRLDDGVGRRVHHLGFELDDAEILIDQLEAGETLGDDCLVVPVAHGDRAYGHLVAAFPTGATSSAVDRRIMRSYARFAAAAIQIVDTLGTARRDRDTAQALLSMASVLADTGDVSTVADKLCRALPDATGCDVASVWLADADDMVTLQVACDATGHHFDLPDPAAQFDPGDLPVAGGVVSGPVLVDAKSIGIRGIDRSDIEPYSEVALVPIGGNDGVVGLALASFMSPVDAVDRPQVTTRLKGLADQAVVAFENARLVEAMRHQMLHDDLTGLPKRALAEDRCRLALARRERTGQKVAVLFVDVDDFKSVNDNLGHAVGDSLLRQIASRLAGELRAADTCARIGGDEFVVLLSDTVGSDAGTEVAERFLRAFEAPFEVDECTLDVTVSIGISWADSTLDDFDELVRRADDAMYEAKAAGKGQISGTR